MNLTEVAIQNGQEKNRRKPTTRYGQEIDLNKQSIREWLLGDLTK